MYSLESQASHLRLGLNTPDVGKKPDPFVTALPTPPFSPGFFSPTNVITKKDDQPLQEFHLFPLLPPELRLKIWNLSFLPRTIELHSRRIHYADTEDYRSGGSPKWKSNSSNPASLSVCIESRIAALEHYTVCLPLDSRLSDSGDTAGRVVYFNLQHDTVALLGDLNFTRLNKLLDWFRDQECQNQKRKRRKGYIAGLRRLAMSTAPWTHDVGAATLRAFSRTVFRDVEEFVLFMYADPLPPNGWKRGKCELEEISPLEDYYRRFVVARGQQFVDPLTKRWMRVGRNEMRVAEIQFEDRW
ncbi:hypothetical protein QBC38DRAFT_510695 [Podospora fimiseda]|uniref:2EXR domain-containing protein n=1 Tax=Podospora fimiseda TaxID=252190 RepID=A0AAN7H0C7_9PEZI|nr:hypothetical protein QBC38DRAFT_510695 [Podospora fimiseda]